MLPVLTKDNMRAITQAITPEQATYVAGINSIAQDVMAINVDKAEVEVYDSIEDITYVCKIMAFADKFKNLHWAATSNDYHARLDEFWEELEDYKDEIAENIQAINGQFRPSQFTKLVLPVGDNPLDIINELKQCINNWFEYHKDDIEYEGCRNATSDFLQTVHKYVYLFRLCKLNND